MKSSTIMAVALGLGVAGAGIYLLSKAKKTTQNIILNNPVVQYVWDEDLPAVNLIANSLGCPAIKTETRDPLYGYTEWILIGGQISNPVYTLMMSDTTPQLPVITETTSNYSIATSSIGTRIYGIAGWEIDDTLSIANKFIMDYQNQG